MRTLIRISMLTIALSVALIAGCATTMVPVGTDRNEGLPPAVDMIVGQKYPQFQRTDPYTPIAITIRNNTNSEVQLRYTQFTLYDPQGRTFVIAPVDEVFDWLRYYQMWDPYYGPYFPRPVGKFVFREGRLKPHKEIQVVMFFNQATRYGEGHYKLVAQIPENLRPLEFTFRLE
jgi:hypothetical protein